MTRAIVVACLVLSVVAIPVAAQGKKDHAMFAPADLVWSAGPPSLPKGAHVAVLKGNPAEEGIFTIRLRLPANYVIPAHWHPAFEHITVVEGTFSMGLGERFDEAALHEMPAGSFMTMAPGTRHFAASTRGGVIQLHGMGPWQIYYVNPADDPRRPPAPGAKGS